MQPKRRHLTCQRTAAVLLELALAIPVLAGIMALSFFIGFAMVNQQHVIHSTRYASWSQVSGVPNYQGNEQEMFFYDRLEVNHKFDSTNLQHQTLDDFVNTVGNESSEAFNLITRCIPGQFPGGNQVQVSAQFPTDIAAWTRISGPIERAHFRDGVQWRRSEVSHLNAIRDSYLLGLHQEVQQIPDDELRAKLEDIYLQVW